MVMLKGYGHIVDFFQTIPWWQLTPDPAHAQFEPQTSVKTEVTRVIYSRSADGKARVYLDGKLVAEQDVPGDFSNWSDDFQLLLGNEATGDRPWRGQIHRIAIYGSDLSPETLTANSTQPLALYTFSGGPGRNIRNEASSGAALDLRVEKGDVHWLNGGGIELRSPVIVRSAKPAAELTRRLKSGSALALEVWIRPASLDQKGPARIVSLSSDPSQRNFTLGQNGAAYEIRLRTTTTSPNGEPAVLTPGVEGPTRYVAALRSDKGDLAVIYFAAGGNARIDRGRISGVKKARWFNPRTGEWAAAQVPQADAISAPDREDWVLLLQ
jgi:hypothetical protein